MNSDANVSPSVVSPVFAGFNLVCAWPGVIAGEVEIFPSQE